ncbi:MAG: aldehyde ferredoxin oxidoreductase family protein [Chloroflexi bacterium]|nr:aldehyde ferredoxin oxidoreductase family protein [Chloroflexota bacterium]
MLTRKIAFIDLTTRKITKQEIPREWREKYIGARGINMLLLYSMVKADTDPLGPDNPLIFGAGLATGVPGFGNSRFNITARSPDTGNLGDSNCGGHFGPELVYAGFHHLVITGKSDKPVYLLITDDNIQIKDASKIWGKNTWETQVAIRQETGDPDLRIAAIGPAGENLCRAANVMTDVKDAAGRFGMGAVMGSKKLKAIAAHGSKDLALAHPQAFLDYFKEQGDALLARKWTKAMKRFGTPLLVAPADTGGWLLSHNDTVSLGEDMKKLYAEKFDEHSLGMASCSACLVHCRARYHIKEGKFAGARGQGPEYGAIGEFGVNTAVLDPAAVIYVSQLCNEAGMDVMEAGFMMGFAMELYEKGIITKADLGRSLDWGDTDGMIALVEDLIARRGFGDVLADGPSCLKRLPPEAAKYMTLIRNGPIAAVGGRVVKSFVFSQAVSTIGGHPHRSRPGTDVLRLPADFLEKFYGGPVSPDYKDYLGKARMVWWHELLYAICDAGGFCRFQTAFNTPNAPAWDEFSKYIYLTSGMDMPVAKLKEVAERMWTTERLLLDRFGVGTREYDMAPEQWYDVPVPAGSAAGEKLDRDKWREMQDEYYQLHSWDKNGVPTPQTVERLQIKPVSIGG